MAPGTNDPVRTRDFGRGQATPTGGLPNPGAGFRAGTASIAPLPGKGANAPGGQLGSQTGGQPAVGSATPIPATPTNPTPLSPGGFSASRLIEQGIQTIEALTGESSHTLAARGRRNFQSIREAVADAGPDDRLPPQAAEKGFGAFDRAGAEDEILDQPGGPAIGVVQSIPKKTRDKDNKIIPGFRINLVTRLGVLIDPETGQALRAPDGGPYTFGNGRMGELIRLAATKSSREREKLPPLEKEQWDEFMRIFLNFYVGQSGWNSSVAAANPPPVRDSGKKKPELEPELEPGTRGNNSSDGSTSLEEPPDLPPFLPPPPPVPASKGPVAHKSKQRPATPRTADTSKQKSGKQQLIPRTTPRTIPSFGGSSHGPRMR